MASAMTVPMAMTTPTCLPMDCDRTGDRSLQLVQLRCAALGAADGTGMSADSQGITMVTRETRSP